MTTRKAFPKPIEIGGFLLDDTGAKPVSVRVQPTKHGWLAAASFARAAEIAAPYWVGDLLCWLETTSGWGEDTIDQLIADTGLARQTLYDQKHVAARVDVDTRQLAPSYSHARAVASLDPKDQKRVLEKARDQELTASQTRKLVKRINRPKVVDGQAQLKGKYRVIVADPPWTYENDGAMPDGSLTPAASSYEGMSVQEICGLPIEAHARKDAVLFLWATNAHIREALQVGNAWGFEYKTNFVWNKVNGRPGPYGYMHHELLLIFTRGACTPDVPIEKHDHASIVTEKRQGEHSQKPEAVIKLITSLYPEGPYLELFARRPRKGWTTFGNDARLWSQSA